MSDQRDMWLEVEKRKKSLTNDIIFLCAALGMDEVATNEDAVEFSKVCMAKTEEELQRTLAFLKGQHAEKPVISKQMRVEMMTAGMARSAAIAEEQRRRREKEGSRTSDRETRSDSRRRA